MKKNLIRTILAVILLVIVQVLVLNSIHLFGCATPLLLVYAIIVFPYGAPRWASLLSGFSLGIVSDIFTNTPGVAAMSLTFIAFVQPALLKLFVSREVTDKFSPSMKTLGTVKFVVFSFILTFLSCALLFLLEDFDFSHWRQLLINICGSTALSYLFILTFESVRKG